MDIYNLLIVLVFMWIGGKVARSFGMPVFLGETLTGFLVGPAVLDLVKVDDTLKILSEFGIFFMILHTGIENTPKDIFSSTKKSFFLATLTFVCPFLLGAYIAQLFGIGLRESFFLGLVVSITGVTIVGRMLREFDIIDTKTKQFVKSCVLWNEIFALIVFSLLIDSHYGASVSLEQVFLILAKTSLFFAVSIVIGHYGFPYLRRIIYQGNRGFTLTLIIALAFASIAKMLDLEMLIGAYLAGVFIHEGILEPKVYAKIEDRFFAISYSFLGPLFFSYLTFLVSFEELINHAFFLVSFICVALFGKLGISYFGARISKFRHHAALSISLLLNCRGSIELVFALIGLQKGILSTGTFSVVVAMTVCTTFFSTLVAKWHEKNV